MNKLKDLLVSVCLIPGIVLIYSCKKDPTLATLKTITPTDITLSSVRSGGEITSSGGADITSRGVCWSTTQSPMISGSHSSDGPGSGTFSSSISGLSPDTKYYIRAYATNSAGTAYGNEVSITTSALTAPVLTTAEISQITVTSSSSGGTITSDGGSPVSAKGVCWSLLANPTTGDYKTSDGTGSANFTSSLTELAPGTLYHVRAYAINSIGTAYGNELIFTTSTPGVPSVTTKIASGVTYNSAVSGGDITDAGGGAISAKGVCWSTSSTPLITDSHTDDGTGTTTFSSNLTSLIQGTTYHVRAYATNSAGTAYGNEITFSTTPVVMAVLSTIDVSLVAATTAHSGGDITSAGGGNISARGVCWSISGSPTINSQKSSNGTGAGPFESDMTGLLANTFYHVRAYATNEAGTAYGDEVTFTTMPQSPPSVTTLDVTAITSSTASSGGNVTDAGNGTITERGVCWGTTTGPTISGSHTSDLPGTGSYTSAVTGLTGSTTYYLRAYATNGFGTSYGNETTFKTYAATDADGNNYTSVAIGAQTWLVENLKTTRYNNGELIGTTVPMTLDITSAVSPEYQWPCGGDEANVAEYGRFYTYYTVTDPRGVCPTGWHLPTDPEWEIMKTYLGGENISGGKVKETGTTHWQTPNTGATNETGFTALPGGYRAINGSFVSLTVTGYFWSSTLNPTPDWAWGQGLHYNDNLLLRGGYYKNDGVSVRCLKN